MQTRAMNGKRDTLEREAGPGNTAGWQRLRAGFGAVPGNHGLAANPALRSENQVLMQLRSTITCPNCGQQKTETMPTDACQFFYDCKGCGAVLRPHPGDCCVFCSYGSVPCPLIQEAHVAGVTARKCCSIS